MALRRFMQSAVDDGSAAISDVKLTSFAFVGALSWTARWQEPGGEMSPAAIASEMVEILIKGIQPGDAARADITDR